jgi:hypothetical protein
MRTIFLSLGITGGSLLTIALVLTVLGLLGQRGRRAVDVLARTPGLDVLISVFTWLPWTIAGTLAGWRGVVGAVVGQVVALVLWTFLHEFAHRKTSAPRVIARFINRTVGRFQNHAALWVTMIALPGFLFIRFLEIVCYPMLVLLLGFPRYRHAEWVNCTRQKFEGLVGHDLVWCLYCDWMTGVYALGAEMLRNVESFWCPIRFYDGKKCENCAVDFPDINGGWVAETGNMADVVQTMEAQYGTGERAWFGHPVRLTVKGREVDART